ncbi:MAG TPA: efflux transporter outer membrane subunit [Rickettsiales bacterium]|nr:efflux transporter outer membrane subunit [Rickettsiales bacterium]
MRTKQKNKLLRFGLLCATSGLLLTGCAVGPDYHPPQMQMPDAFVGVAGGKAKKGNVVMVAQWWKTLNDETLNALIDKAIKANPELGIALDHVQQAREQEAVVLGHALPLAGASAGGAGGTGSDLARGRVSQALISGQNLDGFSHVNEIYGFDAGWELDLFGKYRREFEAAGYDEEAAEAARNNVLITIVADIVRTYADMRGLQMQQAVLEKNIEAAQRYVYFVKQRYDRGITNGLDLNIAMREQAGLEARRAPLMAQVKATQYTIAVLCGEFPENMVTELSKPGQIPPLPPELSTGVPLDLLRNRPDIREAERSLASATAHVGVAVADLFPHFSLTGGAGEQAYGLGLHPGQHSFIWSFGPSASMPLLDFGALDAAVHVADFQAHAQLQQYKQTVLNAVREADIAASDYAAQQERLKNLETALKASQQAVSIAAQRFDRGLTDSLNVIDAQRQQYDLEQQYVIAQQTAAERFVDLYKALGSGWEQYQKLPDVPTPLPAVIAALKRTVSSGDVGK